MSSSVNPEYRLLNLKRRLTDLLMSRRLSARSEQTGVVELGDFGKKCDKLADFCAESLGEMQNSRGQEARCARRILEETELAARISALIETLPRSLGNIELQCDLLDDPAKMLAAALKIELLQEEPDVRVGLGKLMEEERELFEDFIEFEGTIEHPAPVLVPRGLLLRTLRRALLEHESGPFKLSVAKDGTVDFGEHQFVPGDHSSEPEAEEDEDDEAPLPRSSKEPSDVKQALDMYAVSDDEALKDFLLAKAVDSTLLFLLSSKLGSHEWVQKARDLPRMPGKRQAVRAEAVIRPIEGWETKAAQRAVDKLAARRAGPELARVPNGAYLMRLFWLEDDRLAADLLALGPAMKRLERGETVEGVRSHALRAWKSLAGLL